MNAATWRVDATRILGQSEIIKVLADLKRRCRRSSNARVNLALFRLVTCCGLRVSEAIGLKLSDIRVGVDRPYLNVRKEITKSKRPRRVPLWWDAATLADLTAWKDERQAKGAKPKDFFLCCQSKSAAGNQLDRQSARARFISSCRDLGKDRQADLTIHDARHTFISHALKGGRTLAEVRDAAGHANVATTSVYLHVATEDDGQVGNLFQFAPPTAS